MANEQVVPAIVDKGPLVPADATGTKVVTAPAADAKSVEEARTYTQEEVDRITGKVRKNAEHRTWKESEAYYKGRLDAAAPRQAPEAPKPEPADVEPVRENYDDYEKYADARAAYIARKETKAEQERADSKKTAQERAEKSAKRDADFQKRARDKYPDIDTRMDSIADLLMLPEVWEAISDSSVGHDIMIHFADSPSDYERIAALPMAAQIREIGKLEARFESAATPKPEPNTQDAAPATPAAEQAAPAAARPAAQPAPATRAPAPIVPIKGGSAPSVNVIKDGMPYEEFVRVRNRQLGRTK